MELQNKLNEIENIIKNILYIDDTPNALLLKNTITNIENQKNKLKNVSPLIEEFINILKQLILFLIKTNNNETIQPETLNNILNDLNKLNSYNTKSIKYIQDEIFKIINTIKEEKESTNIIPPPIPVTPISPPELPTEEQILINNSIDSILKKISVKMNEINNKINYIDTSNRKLNLLKSNYINTFSEFNKKIKVIKQLISTNSKNKKQILNKLIIISNNVFVKYVKLVNEFYIINSETPFERDFINKINQFNNLLTKLDKYYKNNNIYKPNSEEITLLLNNIFELFNFIDYNISITHDTLTSNELIIRNKIKSTSSIFNKYIGNLRGGYKKTLKKRKVKFNKTRKY